MARATNILTIDVEDWFHILESDDAPGRDRWPTLPSRVEANTDRILALLAEGGATATFFVVGWVALQRPELIRRIADAGHEIASHSFWHEVVGRHDHASLRADLAASRERLEQAAGNPVLGFRAPGNSITPTQAWAFDLIHAAGYRYDASLCPAVSSHGGYPSPYLGPHLVRCERGDLVEIPSATFGAGPYRIPYAGGGYIRLLPLGFLRLAIALDNARGRPTNIYLHPREIDVDQPRMEMPALRRFKYYVGLHTTERKLRAVLARHRFVGMSEWIDENRDTLGADVLDVREAARATPPAPDPALVPPTPPAMV